MSDRWDALLASVVQESVRQGVLPGTWDLAVDGSSVESGAHSSGLPSCRYLPCLPWIQMLPTIPHGHDGQALYEGIFVAKLSEIAQTGSVSCRSVRGATQRGRIDD